jgi:hypothetical protein
MNFFQTLHNGENADQEAPADAEGEQEDEEDDDDHVVITTERPEQETQEQQQYAADESYAQNNEHQETEQTYGNGNGNGNFGYGQNQQGFGGMDFSNMNNFNPMMMQNGMGMPNFAMGMQNMMGEFLRRNYTFPRNRLRRWQGMPGMNMDPSMMFNGGFGGMGGMNDMSMMNMGMGMGNMGGFGGMPGMGMGGGPGFFPGNGGYNQPSFGNNMHQNFHHNRGYGGRPYGRGFRGRGWGGYNRGRGNWQNQGHFQGSNPNYMNQQYHQQQRNFQGDDENATMGQQQGIRRGSPSYEPMNDSGRAVDDNHQESLQAKAEDGGDTNKPDIEITDQTGDAASEVRMTDPEGKESTQPLDEEGIEGKHDFVERSPAQANAQIQAEWEASTEASVQDVVNDVSIDGMDNGPGATDLNAEGGAEIGSMTKGGEANAAMQGAAQSQFYDQQHLQGYGYGAPGRGGFRGGRGGFRGRGGAYGYVAFPGEPEQAVAPPINAPTGPKALREGKPNHGRYSRPPPPVPPAVSSAIETTREQPPTRDERGRSRSRSRSVSDRGNMKERDGSRDEYYESDEARHEKRRRRDDDDDDDDYDATRNGDANKDKLSRKGRSRSETPDEEQSKEQSKRRYRDNDEDRHHSRSHRERSRDRHRRRHRSRSPERDASDKEGDVDGSRRKSKSDRRRDGDYDESKYSKDKEKSRKSSRRDDDYERDYKDRSNNSSKHPRSGRDERDRDRERGKPRPLLEEPQDDIGFKIKGSKSASMQAGVNTSMKPPTTFARDRDSRRQSTQDPATGTPNTPAGDPYAEEREKRQRERLDRENTLRRQSTQSLGKRTSRDEDEFDVPMGPKSDTGRGVKKPRRKVSYKYEDEVADGYEERDRRWR